MKIGRNIDLQRKLIENMNEIVCHMNNEYAYELWILTYPDGADEDEVREMAEMDDGKYFDEIAAAFFRVCKAYGKDGMCTITI